MKYHKSVCAERIPGAAWHVIVALLAGSVAVGGCTSKPAGRPDRSVVSGTVKYKDKPVTGGRLTFISAANSGNTAMCLIHEDGTFSVGDAPLGENKVTIDTESTKPELGARYVQIPTKYSASPTTGLTFDVKLGENTADFDLK
jgi:hypothetical protein